MTALTAFYDWVLPHAPKCEPALGLLYIRQALIDLCEKGLIWREDAPDIAVLAPVSTTTSAAASVGATSLSVADETGFSDGNGIIVDQEDGTQHRTTVSGTPTPGTIALAVGTVAAVESGAAVRKVTEDYALTPTSGKSFVKVLSGRFNGEPIYPILEEEIDTLYSEWRTRFDVPERFYCPDDTAIRLIWMPSAAGVLQLKWAVRPSPTATTVPDWIYDRHHELVGMGAASKILAVPQKPWTDLNLAGALKTLFGDGIAAARDSAERGRTRVPKRTRTMTGII